MANQFNNVAQKARLFTTKNAFTNKVSHYLRRGKLIDSFRLSLRSNSPESLTHLLNHPDLDSFVVTNALHSAPSPSSALSLVEALEKIPFFSHTQNTIHAVAKILAKSQQRTRLEELIGAINNGIFTNIARVSFMDRLRWFSSSGDIDSVLRVWDELRSQEKRPCTEAYNIVMGIYVDMGRNPEAVELFYKLVDEGAIPNSRTYTIMIGHLVKHGKLDPALEIFNVLPSMRIKRTLKQYSILVEGFTAKQQFDAVKSLIDEMREDGILPGSSMLLSLQSMREAGFLHETADYLRELLPDDRIAKVSSGNACNDDDEEDDGDDGNMNHITSVDADIDVQLKRWVDPRALAGALNNWKHDEVTALEDAKFVWTTRLVCRVLRNFKSPEAAWDFFCWVARQPGYTHDIYTVQRMLSLVARHGLVELADKLILKVKNEGMRLPCSTIKLIIDFFGISKNADAAVKVFQDSKQLCGSISSRNMIILYSALLRTLLKCDRSPDAIDVVEEMISCGLNPDIQTFSGLMHHFAQQGDMGTVQKLFVMLRKTGVEPDSYMFKVLIHAYCKSGRASLAFRMFEVMRNFSLMPDVATKELLVKSLWKEGKRREAAAVEEICEETSDVLPLSLRGHLWTVSSSDLSRVYNIYCSSFKTTS